jgi:four helix bundle protein
MNIKFSGPIEQKSFQYSIDIIRTYKRLSSEQKEFVMSRQLLRSGTAVGALVKEGQNAESKKDFIHKYHIAQKECDESIYWIQLLYQTQYLSKTETINLTNQAGQLLKMIRSAIITTKERLARA